MSRLDDLARRGDPGERGSQETALEPARDVAVVHSRPAWLLDET